MDPSYNDSFGSFAQPTAVVSDDKGKKRWIIVAIIFAILALTAIIVTFIVGGGKIKTGFTPEEKYLNYIVNGDLDNSADVGTEYSPSRNYVFADAVNLDDYQIVYFDKAIELLNSTTLDKSSLGYTEQLAMLEMFKTYKHLRELGTGGVADFYISGGAEGINEGIMGSINYLNGDMNRYISNYKIDTAVYVDGIIKMVDAMKVNGCVFNGSTECIVTEDINNISMNNLKLFRKIVDDIDKSIPVFIDLVYSVVGVKNG